MVAERERRARLVATIATILEIATRRIPVLPEDVPRIHARRLTQPGSTVLRGRCITCGPHGWMQVVAFFVTGLLVLTFAVGLRRSLSRRRSSTIGGVLLGLFGAAIVASSARADWTSVHGHDPSTPNGWVHGLPFVVAVPSILAATAVLGVAFRGDRRWRPFAIASPLVGWRWSSRSSSARTARQRSSCS